MTKKYCSLLFNQSLPLAAMALTVIIINCAGPSEDAGFSGPGEAGSKTSKDAQAEKSSSDYLEQRQEEAQEKSKPQKPSDSSEKSEGDTCLSSIGFDAVTTIDLANESEQDSISLGITEQRSLNFYREVFYENHLKNFPPMNLASTYDVSLEFIAVAPGQLHWKLLGVHHLLPNENKSKHNIFIEAIDEDGQVLRGQEYQVLCGDSPAKALDKGQGEDYGADCPLFGGPVSVQMDGLSSDQAFNIHYAHPDEPLPTGEIYNSFGHHSFYVVFARVQAPIHKTLRGEFTFYDSSEAQNLRESIKASQLYLLAGNTQFPVDLNHEEMSFAIEIPAELFQNEELTFALHSAKDSESVPASYTFAIPQEIQDPYIEIAAEFAPCP